MQKREHLLVGERLNNNIQLYKKSFKIYTLHVKVQDIPSIVITAHDTSIAATQKRAMAHDK